MPFLGPPAQIASITTKRVASHKNCLSSAHCALRFCRHDESRQANLNETFQKF